MSFKKLHQFWAKYVGELDIIMTNIRYNNLLRTWHILRKYIRHAKHPPRTSSAFTKTVGIIVICLTSSILNDETIADSNSLQGFFTLSIRYCLPSSRSWSKKFSISMTRSTKVCAAFLKSPLLNASSVDIGHEIWTSEAIRCLFQMASCK